jgi:ATP-dependent DNA ligase
MPDLKTKARFIESMPLLCAKSLLQGRALTCELKPDGLRAETVKTGGRAYLRSRNEDDFDAGYVAICQHLAEMPGETVIDGEIVTLDEMVLYRDHCAGALTQAVAGHASSSNPRQAPPS